MGNKTLLFCPGPVNVAENVKEAAFFAEIGHREKEFSELMESLNQNILDLLEVSKKDDFTALVLTGSSTAANEAVLSSVDPAIPVLVLSNGEFGERLYNIAALHRSSVYHLSFDWANPIDMDEVETAIEKWNIGMIAMVHHETSTGMLNPIEQVGQLTKKHRLMFMVDAVSSMGAEKIDLEAWNISFCTGASGKAIASFPGSPIIIGRNEYFQALKDVPGRMVYLSLYRHYEYFQKYRQTPNTPAVQLFFALKQAVSNILIKGVGEYRDEIQQRAFYFRSIMPELGLAPLLRDHRESKVLTCAYLPDGMSFEILNRQLRDKGIIVYNGKGPLLNKIFQIGHIGELNRRDIDYFVSILSEMLAPYRTKDYSVPALSL